MVTRYGMSDALRPLAYGASSVTSDGFARLSASAAISADTARASDAAIRGIVEANYARAREILEGHRLELCRLAQALAEHETLDRRQIGEVLLSQPASGQVRCLE